MFVYRFRCFLCVSVLYFELCVCVCVLQLMLKRPHFFDIEFDSIKPRRLDVCDFERDSIEAEKNGIDNEGWTSLLLGGWTPLGLSLQYLAQICKSLQKLPLSAGASTVIIGRPPQLLQVYIFNRCFSIFINQQRSILCIYESDVVLVLAGSRKKPKTSGPTIYQTNSKENNSIAQVCAYVYS